MRLVSLLRTELITTLLLIFSSTGCVGKPTPFPGKQTSLISPDKQRELVNRDADNDSGVVRLGGNHSLFLREAKTGMETRIHTYNRHIEASWSPDGRFVAVTDFAASDESVCFIYRVADGKLVRLTDALKEVLSGTDKLKNHHVYFRAETWQNGPILKVKVSGFGDQDPKGFETWCLYDVARDQATLLRSK